MFETSSLTEKQKEATQKIIGILNGLRLNDAQVVLSVVNDAIITNSYVQISASALSEKRG